MSDRSLYLMCLVLPKYKEAPYWGSMQPDQHEDIIQGFCTLPLPLLPHAFVKCCRLLNLI